MLAHKVAITLEATHAREVIEQAFARYGAPGIVNTDQGSQFTAVDFTEVVLARGCKLSMDGRGAWRDSVFVERAVAQREVRKGVPEGLRQRECGPNGHCRLPWTGTTRLARIRVWSALRRRKSTWPCCRN